MGALSPPSLSLAACPLDALLRPEAASFPSTARLLVASGCAHVERTGLRPRAGKSRSEVLRRVTSTCSLPPAPLRLPTHSPPLPRSRPARGTAAHSSGQSCSGSARGSVCCGGYERGGAQGLCAFHSTHTKAVKGEGCLQAGYLGVKTSLDHRVRLFQNKHPLTPHPRQIPTLTREIMTLSSLSTPGWRRVLDKQECQEDLGTTHCLVRTLPFPQRWPMRLGVTRLRSRVKTSRS